MEVYYTEKFVKKNGLSEVNDLFTINHYLVILRNIGLLIENNIPFRFNGKDIFIGEE